MKIKIPVTGLRIGDVMTVRNGEGGLRVTVQSIQVQDGWTHWWGRGVVVEQGERGRLGDTVKTNGVLSPDAVVTVTR